MSKRNRVTKEDYKDHPFLREDLGEPHNPRYGCWCAVCSGYMCGCPCPKEKKE